MFLAAAALAQPLAAQNVTWGSSGLPPGLTISSMNGTTGKIAGTPTSAGIYEAVVYPLVNGMAGDMTKLKFSILPAGANVPVYYGYGRRAQGTLLYALAGGGGRILIARTDQWIPSNLNVVKGLLTTTNGIAFTSRPSPIGMNLISSAAISGNRTVVTGKRGDNYDSDPLLAAYSDSPTGAFTNLPLPVTTTRRDGFLFGSSANFFLGVVSQDFPSTGPVATLGVWSAANTSTAWVKRLTTPLASESLNSTSPKTLPPRFCPPTGTEYRKNFLSVPIPGSRGLR